MHQGICGGLYDCLNLNMIYLHSWKEQIESLKASFEAIHFIHIHREFITVAYQLSKKASTQLGRTN